ncbi:MAG: FKBP-type peptidyl-prolyl cis-trans isomerase [Jatrophihabitans sp.]
MTTNKQRREAERRRLQRQLDERRQRESSRKQVTLIASIIGTLVVIAAVIAVIVVATGGSGNNKNTADKTGSVSSAAARPTTTPSTQPAAQPPVALPAPPACAKPSAAKTVTFDGVTVLNPTDLTKDPKARSMSATAPRSLLCQDLVVGKGKPASAKSSVTVQYSGLLYKNGTVFDSSWSGGQAATFSLAPGSVIDGFSQGIGGNGKVTPMREGGRRILIMPSELGYKNQAQGSVPANAALVFVVDLVRASG